MRKALVVWGGWQGHEPEQCAHIVADLLREDGFMVEVTGDLGIFGSPTLAKADLLVPIITGETLEKPHASALVEAVRAVMAGKPQPAAHGFDQGASVGFFQRFAGDDRHKQIGFGERRRSEYAEIAGDLDRKIVLA